MTTQKNKMYFPDELFSIIKEFAGIYDMRCPNSDMEKNHITNCLLVLGIYEKKRYGCCMGLGSCSKKHQLQAIYKHRRHAIGINLDYSLSSWSLETAIKMHQICKPTTKHLSVGDELVSSSISHIVSNENCAVITKITDYKIQIKTYKLSPTIHYYPANENDTISANLDKVPFYSRTSDGRLFKTTNFTTHGQITQDQLIWEVQYYDKTKFNRAKSVCYSTINPHLKKAINNFTPLWNSGGGDWIRAWLRPDHDISNFVCYKKLIYNIN